MWTHLQLSMRLVMFLNKVGLTFCMVFSKFKIGLTHCMVVSELKIGLTHHMEFSEFKIGLMSCMVFSEFKIGLRLCMVNSRFKIGLVLCMVNSCFKIGLVHCMVNGAFKIGHRLHGSMDSIISTLCPLVFEVTNIITVGLSMCLSKRLEIYVNMGIWKMKRGEERSEQEHHYKIVRWWKMVT